METKSFYLTTGHIGTDLFERIRKQEAEMYNLAVKCQSGETLEDRMLMHQMNATLKADTNNFLQLTKPLNK